MRLGRVRNLASPSSPLGDFSSPSPASVDFPLALALTVLLSLATLGSLELSLGVRDALGTSSENSGDRDLVPLAAGVPATDADAAALGAAAPAVVLTLVAGAAAGPSTSDSLEALKLVRPGVLGAVPVPAAPAPTTPAAAPATAGFTGSGAVSSARCSSATYASPPSHSTWCARKKARMCTQSGQLSVWQGWAEQAMARQATAGHRWAGRSRAGAARERCTEGSVRSRTLAMPLGSRASTTTMSPGPTPS